MVRILILSVLMSVCLTSCDPQGADGDYTFKGVVLDYTTNARVPDANIVLQRADGFSPGGNLNNIIFDYGQANGSGEYNLGVDWVNGKMIYKVEAGKTGYQPALLLCGPFIIGKFLQAGTTTYKDTIYIDRETILKIVVNNLLPASATDTLDVRITRNITCSGGFPSGVYNAKEKQFLGNVSGQVLADSFSLKSTPDVKINWTVRNGGVISTNEQTVSLTAFGTTTFNLDY